MLNRRFNRTTWIMVGLIGFLLGLIGARFLPSVHESWIILAIFLALAGLRGYKLSALSILLVGLLLGWSRGNQRLISLKQYEQIYGQKVVLTAKATNDAIYSDRGQLEFTAGNINLVEPFERELPGAISVRGFGATSIMRGDIVQIEGKIYPTIGSKQARMSFAELAVTGRDNSMIENFRHDFAAGMQNALPEPLASFGLGLLIGQRDTLPENIKKQLSVVGLTHIVAVSGYNLTILTRAARRAFSRRSKFQTLIFSTLLVAWFLLITGLSASIVRAAIVSLLSLFAWYFGRAIKPIMILLLAAAITAGWNPSYIWSDIGWYLSFLAFFGVLVLAPLLIKRVSKSKTVKPLTHLLAESFSAWLMTAPLIIFIFRDLSTVALVANLLIVPLVPLAMLFSAVAALAGTYFLQFASLLALPARALLTFILDVAHILTQIPNALVQYSLSASQMGAIYSLVILFAVMLWHKTKKANTNNSII